MRIFQLAKPGWISAGLGGALYHGSSAGEIRDVCAACELRYDEDLLGRIRTLESAYGAEINRKQ